MTTRKKAKKPQWVPRSDEYRKETVKLADTVGATVAAKHLGTNTSQITIGAAS